MGSEGRAGGRARAPRARVGHAGARGSARRAVTAAREANLLSPTSARAPRVQRTVIILNLLILNALGQTGRLHGGGRTGCIERGCCARNGMVSAARQS